MKRKMEMIHLKTRAVIFDLDCTLHDRETSLFLFLKSQYQRLLEGNVSFTFDQYYIEFVKLEEFGRKWKDTVYRELLVKYSISELTSEELLNDYVKNFKNHCVLFKDTVEMLTELQKAGYKLGMITNGKTDFQKATINSLNIDPYFQDIIISGEIGLKKPDRRIFEASLKNLKVSAGDAIYIGDHPIDDVEAAKAAGLKTIWKRNEYWGEARSHSTFAEMKSLPSIVESLFL
jgi:putative hydrolase of the HAD superfamily